MEGVFWVEIVIDSRGLKELIRIEVSNYAMVRLRWAGSPGCAAYDASVITNSIIL